MNSNIQYIFISITYIICKAGESCTREVTLDWILHYSRSVRPLQLGTQLLYLKNDCGTLLILWPSAAWVAPDTQPLSEKWLRDATSKPRIWCFDLWIGTSSYMYFQKHKKGSGCQRRRRIIQKDGVPSDCLAVQQNFATIYCVGLQVLLFLKARNTRQWCS
jgi:hypothetical protein